MHSFTCSLSHDDDFSPTAARLDYHILIVLDDHLVVAVDVQHRDGAHLGRNAARSRHRQRVDGVDERLYHGVVGRVQVVGHVVRALASTVERLVAGGRYYPVVPADLAEVDVQRPSAAASVMLALSRPAPSTAAVLRRPLRVAAASTTVTIVSSADVGRPRRLI